MIVDEKALVAELWPNGHLNPLIVAQDADKMIAALGLMRKVADGTDYIAVETSGIGVGHPLSGEKLSRVLAVHRATDFDAALDIVRRVQVHQGAGHSVGIHSSDPKRPIQLAMAIATCHIIVNQAHTFATGGAFNNGMPFSHSHLDGRAAAQGIGVVFPETDDTLSWRDLRDAARSVASDLTARGLHGHASPLAGGWTTFIAHHLTPWYRGYCVLPIYHINGLFAP